MSSRPSEMAFTTREMTDGLPLGEESRTTTCRQINLVSGFPLLTALFKTSSSSLSHALFNYEVLVVSVILQLIVKVSRMQIVSMLLGSACL